MLVFSKFYLFFDFKILTKNLVFMPPISLYDLIVENYQRCLTRLFTAYITMWFYLRRCCVVSNESLSRENKLLIPALNNGELQRYLIQYELTSKDVISKGETKIMTSNQGSKVAEYKVENVLKNSHRALQKLQQQTDHSKGKS